jgi:hypothetical protein
MKLKKDGATVRTAGNGCSRQSAPSGVSARRKPGWFFYLLQSELEIEVDVD